MTEISVETPKVSVKGSHSSKNLGSVLEPWRRRDSVKQFCYKVSMNSFCCKCMRAKPISGDRFNTHEQATVCLLFWAPLFERPGSLLGLIPRVESGETRIMASQWVDWANFGAFDLGNHFFHSASLRSETCQENRAEVSQVSARHGVGFYSKTVVFVILCCASLGSLSRWLDVPKWLRFV